MNSQTHAQELAQYWLEHVGDEELLQELKALIDSTDDAALRDAFYQNLSFGTAGLRGVVGVGTNRMNIYTVGRATQGFANYILSLSSNNPCVAIARDPRHKGDQFVAHAASILAANGITTYLFPRVAPTPVLSFAVRELSCIAGICMTASHNPAAYNGYKAYGSDGCQITSDAANAISNAIDQIDPFTQVKTMNFDQAMDQKLIQWIDDSLLDSFISAVVGFGFEPEASRTTPLSVVYTPLCGTGLECASRIFGAIDIHDVHLVDAQAHPDGDFPTCPYPNPEEPEALREGIACAKQHEADLLLATDPDADRVGIAVLHDGEYVLPTGNELGILLLNYLCEMRSVSREMPERPLAISTIVSTTMIDAIAAAFNVEIQRTLTGFKYIGARITALEQCGEEKRFIFGFEESYGYLAGTHVRDKDAIIACMLVCQMARFYKSEGRDLIDVLHDLYKTYGFYANRTINIAFPGEKGAHDMDALMDKLREHTPSSIHDFAVETTLDYQTGQGGLPPANVFEIKLASNQKVIFRPSGTEPKIKIYLFAQGTSAQDVQNILDDLECGARALLA